MVAQRQTHEAEAVSVLKLGAPAPCPSHLLAFATEDDRPFALVSGRGDSALSEWSYAGLEAIDVATSPAEADAKARRLVPAGASAPPFSGGAVGHIAYDLGFAYSARPRIPRRDALGLPECRFFLYDAIYARNERTLEGFLVAQPTREAERRRDRLARALIANPPELGRGGLARAPEPAILKALHLSRIEDALELIHAGEIYQVNLTYPLLGRFMGDPRAAFSRLLHGSAPPFSAFLSPAPETAVISASPECFFTFDARSRRIASYPIKGTRRRSTDPEQDAALARDLVASHKDRAEHVMIVDLLRNDLGRIAEIGSVSVPSRAYVESFAGVHHLTSRVEGVVLAGLGLDAILSAVFPGGSITGAPKLRAMEIIDALEDAPRGIYTGSIAWIAASGSASFSIAIRTAAIVRETLHLGVGGGIVADSTPESEWEETEVKARAITRALLSP